MQQIDAQNNNRSGIAKNGEIRRETPFWTPHGLDSDPQILLRRLFFRPLPPSKQARTPQATATSYQLTDRAVVVVTAGPAAVLALVEVLAVEGDDSLSGAFVQAVGWGPCDLGTGHVRASDCHIPGTYRVSGPLDRTALTSAGASLAHPYPLSTFRFRNTRSWRTIVRIANQKRSALQTWPHLPREPVVQHMVQEDVRKYR